MLALPFLPGGWAANRDVILMVCIAWSVVSLIAFAAHRGHLRRLLKEAGVGGWIDEVKARRLLRYVGWFSLFAIFDILIQGYASHLFGVDIAWTALAARIPILYLAISIPSLGNFGTREIAWATLFEGYGTEGELIAFALWTNVIFLVMHVIIGVTFASRAFSLIREMRRVKGEGQKIRGSLLRDAIDR